MIFIEKRTLQTTVLYITKDINNVIVIKQGGMPNTASFGFRGFVSTYEEMRQWVETPPPRCVLGLLI